MGLSEFDSLINVSRSSVEFLRSDGPFVVEFRKELWNYLFRKMPPADTYNWKFTGLLGAFLDLAIAYMFLCTSLFVYLALKFIGVLGLPLSSFHNGRFGDVNKGKCLQRHLGDCASERISAVDRSVRSKIPFDLITDDHSNQRFELKLVRKNSGDVSNSRIRSEESSRCIPEQHEAEDVPKEDQSLMNNGHGGFGLMSVHSATKGKRFVTRRMRNGLRNHRRGRVDSGRLRSITSFDGLQAIGETIGSWPWPSDDVARVGDVSTERGPEVANSEDGKNATNGISLQQNSFNGSELDEHQDKHKGRGTEAGQSFDQNAENAVRLLEEALEEERAARSAICVELEKERNAAASAADEAMAMILRLQDEKASIEMDARQFQRMVEEKSTFDAEEMNILKDILVQREREKHFLEKEVEAYRQLLVETDELESLTRQGADQMPMGGNESSTEREEMEKQGDKHEDQIENQDLQVKRPLLVQEGRKEHDETVIDMPYREDNIEKSRDLYKSDSELAYSRVRDVYAVKDEANNSKTQNIGRKNLEESDPPAAGKPESSRGSIVSEMARRLPPLCRPRRTSLQSSGSRRKSMTAVDYERLKIENEVELLRERLKAVQEGREKLTRRASLPPLSSKVKVTSERRSNRRSSLDIHSS